MAEAGIRVRFTPIRGETKRSILSSPLYLPAVLDEFSLVEDGAHTDYDTVRMGEYSVPQFGEQRNMRKLRTTDLEALTLYWPAAWLHPASRAAADGGIGERNSPDWVEEKLNDINRSRQPVEMLVRLHQPGWNDAIVRMAVTIRNVTLRVKPGEADTKYWTVSIKEWRPNATARRRHGEAKKKLPTTKRLDANDTLESLSKHYYGSYAGWRAIAKENGIKKWGKTTPLVNMKRYKVGSVIKIPRKPPIATTNPPKRSSTGGTAAPA